jgi:hypothetical protein
MGVDMPGVTRRTFLGRGSLAVAAAGVLSSVPGIGALVGAAESGAPAADAAGADAAGADAAGADLTEPLVAHVRDAATGEISVFSGTREVVLRDPRLVAQLLRAAR